MYKIAYTGFPVLARFVGLSSTVMCLQEVQTRTGTSQTPERLKGDQCDTVLIACHS
jgi:hypothetical protein